jgi:hypothetical protein
MRLEMGSHICGWIAIAVVTLGACEVHKRDSSATGSGSDHAVTPSPSSNLSAADRTRLRAEVLAAVRPPFGHQEYLVTDPVFVDPCIDDALAHQRSRADVVTDARMCVSNDLYTPDGLARIAALVADRYDHPTITRTGDAVVIDVGVAKATFMSFRAKIVIAKSPVLDNGEWVTPEVVRVLKLGISAHPDAKSYRATLQIPEAFGTPTWTYAYDRQADQLQESSDDMINEVYVTDPLGGSLDHLKSASRYSMKLQSLWNKPVDPTRQP